METKNTLKLASHGYDILNSEGVKVGEIRPKKVNYLHAGGKQVRWFYSGARVSKIQTWGCVSSVAALKEFNSL